VVKLVARDGAWSILMWRRQVPLKKISGGITRADKDFNFIQPHTLHRINLDGEGISTFDE
jgi:hypothetical protein